MGLSVTDVSKPGSALRIDPLVEVIVGLLIVRPDQRPAWVKTYDDARKYAEHWAKRLRGTT